MALPDKVDYLIIGAGIHGLSTAWHLAEKLKAKDVLGGNGGSRWRFATHYGIEEQDVKDTLNIFEQSIKEL